MTQRIAVVGGVAAGPAAAAEARRTDPEADVVLFEQGAHISYGACEMPYYLAGTIEDAETLLVLEPAAFERTRGVPVRLHACVERVDPRRARVHWRDVQTDEAHEERFDKVILAVGARARWPEALPRGEGGIFPMRRLEDAKAIRAYLDTHTVRHAVVIGGGYVGVEVAEAMCDRGVRATILEPAEGGPLHKYVDAPLRKIIHQAMREHGIVWRCEAATGVGWLPGGRFDLHTDKGERIGCDLVIVCMGITPNTELAEAAGATLSRTTGAVAVDAGMKTSVPGLWACGDCVEVERVIDRRKIYLPLSPVAFGTAHVAGANAARRGRGAPRRHPGIVGASGVKLFGWELAAVGLGLDAAREAGFDAVASGRKHWSRVQIYPGSQPVHVRYIVERGTGRLLGGQLVGREGAALRADVLVPLIRQGATLHDLLELDLIYNPPLAPAHDPLLVAAHHAVKEVGL